MAKKSNATEIKSATLLSIVFFWISSIDNVKPTNNGDTTDSKEKQFWQFETTMHGAVLLIIYLISTCISYTYIYICIYIYMFIFIRSKEQGG